LALHQRSGDVEYVVGDFNDTTMMKALMEQENAEVIFHAAAYKHVPVMEQNVAAALRNNVFGLVGFLDLAERCGCQSFILISSDKAVNPTSVMGATKRIGELVIAGRPSAGLRCVSVRFGNVLGSNGSLIPILTDQLRRGEPLTITHPEIRRFFMTTEEAVSLVLQAFAIGVHRDILVLDMGDSLRIFDLAKTLIRLSGKSESEVPIVFTGLREGEKFFEELFYESEEILPSAFPKIKRTKGLTTDWSDLMKQLDILRRAVTAGDELQMRNGIRGIVPEYTCPALGPAESTAASPKAPISSSCSA
jgi:FlaA1/EpsC-like NDP-sugar epimerase